MPLFDWVRLAARGVVRRKWRSLSSAVGIAAATALLAITLAGGQGIMAALQRELLSNPWLRRIQVMPIYEQDAADAPPEAVPELEVADPELRQRLIARYQRIWVNSTDALAVTGISIQELQAFRELEGVEFALPSVQEPLEVQFGERPAMFLQAVGTRIEDVDRQRRMVVVGEADRNHANRDQVCGVVLSEFAAYEMGFREPEKWQELIGKPIEIRVSLDEERLATRLQYMAALGVDEVSIADVVELKDALDHLPELLSEAGLTEDQIRLLGSLLGHQPATDERAAEESGRDVEVAPKFLTRQWPIIGIYRDPTDEEARRLPWSERSHGVDLWLNAAATDELVSHLPHVQKEGFFEVRVDVGVGRDLQSVQAAIDARGWQSYSMADFVDYLMGQVRAGGTVFLVVSIAIFAVCALNIFNTQSLAVLERTYEIGILKALGARTSEILGVFLLEAMTLGWIASQLGWLLGWGISQLAEASIASRLAGQIDGEQLGEIFMWSGWLWLGVTGLGTLVCGLAAAIPARHAARVDPVEALRAR